MLKANVDQSDDSTAEVLEASRIDDEAAAIALKRIRSGAADEGEDGFNALRRLGIQIRSSSGGSAVPPDTIVI